MTGSSSTTIWAATTTPSSFASTTMTDTPAAAGRIDVHSHLLPSVDDGCSTLPESLECARHMVAAGYTHSFVTPHYWPNLKTRAATVRQWTRDLQIALDAWRIPLQLFPGGEINLRPDTSTNDPAELVSYGLAQ